MRTLTWNDLNKLGKTDGGNRYYPHNEVCSKYISENGYRTPSRAWPYSYAKPLMTKKFSKWCEVNAPEFAEKFQ